MNVLAYVLLLYISLAATFYARDHPHLGVAMVAEYAAPWPLASRPECQKARPP